MGDVRRLGKTILEYERKRRGWTREHIAEQTGVALQTVGRWERREQFPRQDAIQKLCDLFNMTAEDLDLSEERLFLSGRQPKQLFDPLLEQQSAQSSELPPEMSVAYPTELPRMASHVSPRSQRKLLIVISCLVAFTMVGGIVTIIAVATQFRAPEAIYKSAIAERPSFQSSLAHQDAYWWDSSGECMFENGVYHVFLQPTEYVRMCFAHNLPRFSNFALQVTMNVIQGTPGKSASGGLVFRAEDPNTHDQSATVYRVPIDVNGSYNFYLGQNIKCNRPSVSNNPPYCRSQFDAFNRGLNQVNTLTIIALGDTVYFYSNGFFIDQANSNLSESGYIGVFANGFQAASELVFSNLKIWKL